MKSLLTKTEMQVVSAQELSDVFLSGKNKNTLNAYRNDLQSFAEFLGLASLHETASQLVGGGGGNANLLVLRFKNSLKESGLQSATINRRLSSIRAIVKLAGTLGIINWSLEIKNEKHEAYRDVRGVGVESVGSLMNLIREKNTPKAKRDYAVTRLFFDLGLRVSELIGLDLDDLQLQENAITILGKGRTQRETLTIPESSKKAVTDWLNMRPLTDSQAVFVNLSRSGKQRHQRITRQGVYSVVKAYGDQLNLKTSNHKFRHDSVTAAIKAAQKHDISLHEVLKFSRHKNLSTLQLYADSFENHQGQIADLVSQSVGDE